MFDNGLHQEDQKLVRDKECAEKMGITKGKQVANDFFPLLVAGLECAKERGATLHRFSIPCLPSADDPSYRPFLESFKKEILELLNNKKFRFEYYGGSFDKEGYIILN